MMWEMGRSLWQAALSKPFGVLVEQVLSVLIIYLQDL